MPIAPKRSRVVFQKLEQDLVKLSSKPRAESVHRFRTGTRRLQILLGELSHEVDKNQKKLLKLLGRIRKRAGKLRDLDVQLAALRSLKIPRPWRIKSTVQKAASASTPFNAVLQLLPHAAPQLLPHAALIPLFPILFVLFMYYGKGK